MTLQPLPEPMEAKLAGALPIGPDWRYEPKWDGFRAIAARDGDKVELLSKSGKSLLRYFPEIGAMLGRLPEATFIVDGELILPVGERLSFDALQQRLHPAASRVERLSRETPTQLMLFDCLQIGSRDLSQAPLTARREALDAFQSGAREPSLLLSPTTNPAEALEWLSRTGGALDGIVAKLGHAPYQPGERAMVKVKTIRTADCVVGGFRRTKEGDGVASLLLGLYNNADKLDQLGFCSSFSADEKHALLEKLQPLIGAPGFTGKAPGGPSRWRTEAAPWEPLRSELVVEVAYDQVTGERFRHGTTFQRWRPDKAPRQCTFDQLELPLSPAELASIVGQDT